MVENSLTSIIETKVPFTIYQVEALIKVFKIHPISAAGNAFIDRLLLQYISDVPPKFN